MYFQIMDSKFYAPSKSSCSSANNSRSHCQLQFYMKQEKKQGNTVTDARKNQLKVCVQTIRK